MKYCIAMAEEKDKESLLLMMKEHAMFEGHNIEITNYKELGKLKSLPVTILPFSLSILITILLVICQS